MKVVMDLLMRVPWFNLCFFTTVFLYSLRNIYVYHKNNENFACNLTLFRKVNYFICLLGVGIGVIVNKIDLSQWLIVSMYVGTSIFIDIAIYQTPSIKKFANAEFDSVEMVNQSLKTSSLNLKNATTKSNKALAIIQDTNLFINASNASQIDEESYRDKLLDYLKEYYKNYEFKIRTYFFNIPQVPDTDPEVNKNIDRIINDIKVVEGLSLEEEEIQEISSKVLVGNIKYLHKDENTDNNYEQAVVAIPIIGKTYKTLICVIGFDITPIDISLIGILAYFFDSNIC